MTDQQQARPGDRVRVTYEATVGEVGDLGIVVLLPGDKGFAQRFTALPAHATVEVLPPPALAERMAALADQLDQDPHIGGYGEGTAEAARLIRKELAAHEAYEADTLARLRERLAAEKAEPPAEYFQDSNGMWSWSCNGAPGCTGWIGHYEHSEAAAKAAWADHAKRQHEGAS